MAATDTPRPVGPGGRALLASEVCHFKRGKLDTCCWRVWKQFPEDCLLPPLLPDTVPPVVLEHRSPGLRVAVRVHFHLGLAGGYNRSWG